MKKETPKFNPVPLSVPLCPTYPLISSSIKRPALNAACSGVKKGVKSAFDPY